MSSFYKRTKLTEEEQEIDTAIDAHSEALDDEKHAVMAAGLLWFSGILLTLFSPMGSQLERIGGVLLILALVCFISSIALSYRTRKKKYEAKALVDPYMRKKALPFYNELTEMFAEKPGIHLHLDERGTIIVTDKRKKEVK